ncbi:hypothetical protein B0H14DRAFT_3472391 [Mycena olivaceomarginata]|nr:hypothetical protein B0H14DRAFT_3472391 [Mycena olivaceomarginata]
MPAPAPLQLSIALGVLQLSHKYDVPYLYKHALDHLPAGWYAETYDGGLDNHLFMEIMGQYALKSLAAHEQMVHGTVSIQHFLIRSEPCLFAGATDPFHCAEVEEYFESLTADGLCGACLEVSRAKRLEAATGFWNELPGVFGLQPWENLRAMKQELMGESSAECRS